MFYGCFCLDFDAPPPRFLLVAYKAHLTGLDGLLDVRSQAAFFIYFLI